MPNDPVQDLVTSIYEAALESDQWAPVLERLVGALGCSRGAIGLSVDGDSHVELGATVGIDPDGTRRWLEEFGGYDPFFDAAGRQIAVPGSAFRAFDVIRPEVVRRTEVYRALYEPGGIDDHLVTVLGSRAGRGSYFSAYRGVTDEPFTDRECELHQMLSVHLTTAVRIHDRLHVLHRAREANEAIVERLPFAFFWLDAAARVLSMNPVAEKLLARGDGLRVRKASIEASAPASQRELSLAIARAIDLASGRDLGGGSFVRIEREVLPPYTALVVPLPPRSREVVFGFEPRPASVALVVSDPDAAPVLVEETLRRLFRLTPALARLALAIAHGKTLAEHADEARITIGTARQQMKELQTRVGRHRQADVVRLILTSVAALERPPGGSSG